ncbi:MAG: polysaccharide deacetylase family protein [bacterium]
MRGIWRAKRLFNRMMPRGAILLYHRVADEPLDPQLLCVSPVHFDEHLQVLRKIFRPMSLASLASQYRFGLMPDRAVAVTFDDGYADNLIGAKPILERNDIPATVFVASGLVGQSAEFWWDELDRLLLTESSLPGELNISINGAVWQWSLGDIACYDSGTARKYSGWTVLSHETPTMRHEIYRFLCKALKGMTCEQQQHVLDTLQKWAGVGSVGRSARRVMTPNEVMRLGQGGIVEVGAHTANHPMLSALPVDAQKSEIIQGKQMLEAWLGRDVNLFAYPYGDKPAYTRETVRIVHEAGFNCSCSNYDGHLYPWTNRYQLPRFVVRNWGGEEFERRLLEYFG